MKTKKSFKNFIKSFNLFEIIWLCSVVVLLSVFMAIFPDALFDDSTNTLVVVCSVISIVANPICELMISKQSRYNFLVSIVFIEITEMIVYFSLHLYSCAIVSLVFWVPIDLVSFFRWKKNVDEVDDNKTKVKALNWWQDLLIVVGIAGFSFLVGWLLSLIPECEDSYLDAFVSALGMANGILLLLRYNEQWYAWFAYLVFDAVLWIISGHYIMLITVVAMMINTIYGFVKWIKYIRAKRKLQTQQTERNDETKDVDEQQEMVDTQVEAVQEVVEESNLTNEENK